MAENNSKQSYCEQSYNAFLARLQEHEIETSTKYVLVKAPKNFNVDKVTPTLNQRIYWQDDVPYYHFGSKTFHCHQGKDRHINAKKKYEEERDKKLIGSLSKHYEQMQVSKTIRKKIEDGENVGEEGFIFNLPSIEKHTHHLMESVGLIGSDESSMPHYQELPLNGSNRRHLINDCNSTLRTLQSVLWYLGENELESLSRSLKDVYESTSSKVSLDEGSGLPVEVETDCCKHKKKDYGKLVLRRKKGSSGRVGMVADMKKESSKITIEDGSQVEMAGKVQCAVCFKWEVSESVSVNKTAKSICKLCC